MSEAAKIKLTTKLPAPAAAVAASAELPAPLIAAAYASEGMILGTNDSVSIQPKI